MTDYSFRYQHLMHLTDNELHNWLVEKGKRPSEIEGIKQAIRSAKDAKRSESARRTYLDNVWREVIHPLANEQRVVYGMKRYNKDRYPNPERREAIDAYEAVLVKVKKKLQRYHKAYTQSPAQKAAELSVPNNGEHWTDWVPLDIKNAIGQAFADIPHTFRARTKTPFERAIPKNQNSARRAKLLEQIQTERIKTEQELSILQDVSKGEDNESIREARCYLETLHDAQRAVLDMDDNALVPHTWKELMQ